MTNKPIKAILTKEVSYVDFNGKAKTIRPGIVLDIVQIKTARFSTDLMGRKGSEVVDSYFGCVGNDTFDISSDEFKTID